MKQISARLIEFNQAVAEIASKTPAEQFDSRMDIVVCLITGDQIRTFDGTNYHGTGYGYVLAANVPDSYREFNYSLPCWK